MAARDTVSVIVPTYNRARLLGAAIRSAYAQTVLPLEVIVVDDGSTDDTESVLQALRAEFGSSLRWVTQANAGGARARNRGIALARGELIAFVDSDDVWRAEKLERQLAAFRADPQLTLLFGAYEWSDGAASRIVRLEEWEATRAFALERLMVGCAITHSTVMVRRSAFELLPPYDERLAVGEDWLMWLKLAALGLKIGYLDEPLVEYRWHESNASRDPEEVADAALEIFPRLFAGGELPRERERWCMARWNMIKAERSAQPSIARRHILRAARLRPASIRPGWLRILLAAKLREQ